MKVSEGVTVIMLATSALVIRKNNNQEIKEEQVRAVRAAVRDFESKFDNEMVEIKNRLYECEVYAKQYKARNF